MRQLRFGRRVGAGIIVATVIATATSGWALPADLDPTFGPPNPDGRVTTLVNGDDVIHAMVRQADGKLVVAGSTRTPGTPSHLDFAIARYNEDGSPDTGFGTDGIVVTDASADSAHDGLDDEAFAVVLQPDGKIVAAGYSQMVDENLNPIGKGVALVRYTPAGVPDLDFGSDPNAPGVVLEHLANGRVGDSEAFGLVFRPAPEGAPADEPTLFIAGYADNPVQGFGEDGLLAGFDDLGGKHLAALNDFADDPAEVSDDRYKALVVAPGDDDAFITVGRRQIGGDVDGLAVRYFEGAPQVSAMFDPGVLTTELNALAFDQDGQIVAAGDIQNADGFHFALIRFSPDDLTSDLGFADGAAVAVTPFSAVDSFAQAVAIQSDGRIVAAGYTNPRPTSSPTATVDFALARYNADGTADATFNGDSNTVTTDFSAPPDTVSNDQAFALVDADGKLVAAGHADALDHSLRGNDSVNPQAVAVPNANVFALARYGASDGGAGGGGGPEPIDSRDFLLTVKDDVDLPRVGGGKLHVEDEDVVRFVASANAYQLIFDGSDVGLSSAAVDAMAIDPATGEFVFSFKHGRRAAGVSKYVHNEDLVAFAPTRLGTTTAGSFRFYFDGSDIGLKSNDGDSNIDAVEVWNGNVYLSTRGTAVVRSNGQALGSADEDVFVCGAATTGLTSKCATLTRHLKGSTLNLGSNDVDGFALSLWLVSHFSTESKYLVPGDAGGDEDVFSCNGGVCEKFFDGSAHSLTEDVADIHRNLAHLATGLLQ